MSNQPPNRPWFRLASIARPAPPMAPAAAPAPAPPQPRPTVSLGAFRNPQEPAPPPTTTRVGSAPASPVAAPRNSPPSRPQVINAPSSPAIKTNSPLPAKFLSPPSPSPLRNTAPSSVPSSPATTTTFSSPKVVAAATTTTYSPPKVIAATTNTIYSPPKVVAATTTATSLSPPRVVYTATARGVSPKSSPIKTPPRSPVSKQIAPPPSPLVLPPSQVETQIPPEAEQKTVLVQKTVERNHHQHQHPVNKHGSGGEAKEKGQKEMGMRVITIAGENRGAYMELIHSPHGLDKKQASTGSESDKKEMHRNGKMASPMRAFTNSNVQGINNSIVFNASCKDNNPGVHLTLSRKGNGNGNGIYAKEEVNGHHTS